MSQVVRILVADDHVVVAEGIQQLLSDGFHAVELVASGEALIERVELGGIDLVIADISMQGIGGMEALRRLSDSGYLVPFFIRNHA